MKTRELIARLQELDPSGNLPVAKIDNAGVAIRLKPEHQTVYETADGTFYVMKIVPLGVRPTDIISL